MVESQNIRVLIVDDHALVRSGLRNFLFAYEEMQVVGEAGDGAEAVEFCATHPVDVVLMDMIMPVMDGNEATQRIIALGLPVKVIILTSFHEEDLVEKALKAGATSYLLKNVSAADLAAAIRAASAGRSTLAPEATEALIHATRQKPGVGFDLTKREQEVLMLLAQGKSNTEIAAQLSISLGTVKFHLTNIYSKLGARSRVEAVTLALEHHLVSKNS
jgi:NarL family two-component system response regulator LiaR